MSGYILAYEGILPYLAFFIGVISGIAFNFYPDVRRGAQLFAGSLTCVIVVSMLLIAVKSEIEVVSRYQKDRAGELILDMSGDPVPFKSKKYVYAYKQSNEKYALFLGILALYGLSSISIFRKMYAQAENYDPKITIK